MMLIKTAAIEQKNQLLHHRAGANIPLKQKTKRSPFDVVGKVSNLLFGILDQDAAREIEDKIEAVKRDENYVRALLKNQTSITETTLNIIKATEIQVEKQFKLFHEKFNNLSNALVDSINELHRSQTFLSLGVTIYMTISNFEYVQDTLLSAVLDTQHGDMHHLIITPEQLINQLGLIRQNIPPTQVLPAADKPEQLLQLYKLMAVSGRITSNYLIFECKIPLLDIETYQLFHVIPIPTPHREYFTYIAPSTDYLITSLSRETYYHLKETEFVSCI